MRALTPTTLLATAAVTLGGCESGPSPEPPLPVIEVQPDLRIDGYDADLVPIPWMGVSRSGIMALIQWQDYSVVFFDQTGRRLGSFGREGEGPGEFRQPIRGGWLGDTLWVSDTRLERVTLISPDLELVRDLSRPPVLAPGPGGRGGERTYASMAPLALYPGDEALMAVWNVVEGPPSDPDVGLRLVRASWSGLIQEEVAALPREEESLVTIDVEGGVVAGTIPFMPSREWAVSPDGGLVAEMANLVRPDSVSVLATVRDSHGSVVFQRELPFGPVRIPAAVMDSAIEVQASRRAENLRSEMRAKLTEAAPEVYPAAERLVLGSDGRVWIGLRRTGEGRPWLVLAPDGEPWGRLVLPREARLAVAEADRIYTIERDEVGVESVVRYRLVVPGS